ncbi:MAG TPA: hypothetical protein VF054_04610 [Micromonosporaceae bacterium]
MTWRILCPECVGDGVVLARRASVPRRRPGVYSAGPGGEATMLEQTTAMSTEIVPRRCRQCRGGGWL